MGITTMQDYTKNDAEMRGLKHVWNTKQLCTNLKWVYRMTILKLLYTALKIEQERLRLVPKNAGGNLLMIHC